VPRAFNAMADWAGNVARQLRGGVDLTSLCVRVHVAGPPPLTVKEAADKMGF
jgi:hypothetical protein